MVTDMHEAHNIEILQRFSLIVPADRIDMLNKKNGSLYMNILSLFFLNPTVKLLSNQGTASSWLEWELHFAMVTVC